ncbi:hypothetical protein F66182_4431 [Fusarium sp. NRRL 66182]|nr:hypothetical protein F66182_4431 [Fusarium sp. NRRL 66182]
MQILIQTIALLSVAASAPSVAGAALPRAKSQTISLESYSHRDCTRRRRWQYHSLISISINIGTIINFNTSININININTIINFNTSSANIPGGNNFPSSSRPSHLVSKDIDPNPPSPVTSLQNETRDHLPAPAQKRPHQDFAQSLTELVLVNTNTRGPGNNSSPAWIPSAASSPNGTYTPRPKSYGVLTIQLATSSTPCTILQENEPVTEYSIVYTATVTFYGNRSEYTAPYPTISTPSFCLSASPFPSFALSQGAWVSKGPLPTALPGVGVSKEPGQDCSSGHSCAPEKAPGWSEPTEAPNPGAPIGITMSTPRATITFVTTDKNPAVVFPTEAPPSFNQPTREGRFLISDKQMPEPSEAPGPTHQDPSRNQDSARPRPDTRPQQSQPKGQPQDRPQDQPPQTEPPKMFDVTARGQEVVINDKTFSSLKPDQTRTVTVDYGTFTIRPTEVVGEGATVKKPQPVGTVVSVITPTSATVASVPVTVSGTEAVIGGKRLKLPLMGMTTRLTVPVVGSHTLVEERQVSIAPDRIVVDDETLTYRGVGGPQTDVLIEGGEMVTAVGKSVVVFHSTTLTYGPGIPETTETVDDDTITLGPSGVVIDGTTLGGADAETTDTKHQIVGGATITKVNPSYVIIDETTFTAGPGAKRTSKVAGGETITIGPDGITIGTMTVKYPFGASIVTTIEAKETASDRLPAATGANSNNAKEDDEENGEENGKADKEDKEDDDSGATCHRSDLTMGLTGLCIAVGVWILF